MTDDDRRGVQDRLAEICGPEPGAAERALLTRLLTSYVTKTPAGLDRLAEVLAAGDVPGVRDQAHALKGSATNLGLTALSLLLGRVEDDARAGRLPEDASSTLDGLRAAYRRAETVCTALAGELQAP